MLGAFVMAAIIIIIVIVILLLKPRGQGNDAMLKSRMNAQETFVCKVHEIVGMNEALRVEENFDDIFYNPDIIGDKSVFNKLAHPRTVIETKANPPKLDIVVAYSQ